MVLTLGRLTATGWAQNCARSLGNVRFSHKGSFSNKDSTVTTDEILSDNNPWSPSLLNDIVKIRPKGLFRSVEMDPKYRLSYSPLYEAPGAKYTSLLKRISISFAVLGVYGGKLFYESASFDDVYGVYTILATSFPAIYIQLKTKDYVTRIWRLYNKTLPQTLPNLLSDEKLIIEKLNWMGTKTYNQVLTITGNNSLKVAKTDGFFSSHKTWSDGISNYYVVDNIGGIKMDRIWGIVEKNSGIDNGRYIEEEKKD